MKRKSILLPIDGSISSKHAATLCWRLTTTEGALLTAQHVIDLPGACELIIHEPTGLLPEKAFVVAYQATHKALEQMAGELESCYRLEAARHGAQSDFVLDFGDPIEQIAKRSKKHDLVIIGHGKMAEKSDRSKIRRTSVAESLAHECARPLLIVQADAGNLKTMTILLSSEHVNENYINACLDFADSFGLEPVLLCLAGSNHQKKAEALIDDLCRANVRIKRVPTIVAELDDISSLYGTSSSVRTLRMDKHGADTTLAVIPTRAIGGERLTVLDSSPINFLRHIDLPTMLLIPEESLTTSSQKAASKLVK